MVVVLKKKMGGPIPSVAVIRHRTAVIRRDWTAKDHCDRYQLANVFQRMLAVELCGLSLAR